MSAEPNYNSPPGIELKLKWRRSWPDKDHDFTATTADGFRVGRFYWRDTAAPGSECWYWTMESSRGEQPTSRQAAKAIEDAWFAWQARKKAAG